MTAKEVARRKAESERRFNEKMVDAAGGAVRSGMLALIATILCGAAPITPAQRTAIVNVQRQISRPDDHAREPVVVRARPVTR